MKHKLSILTFLILLPVVVFGQAVKIENIHYQLMPAGKAIVTEGKYEGHITIPETIKYKDQLYTVEEIGYAAFNESIGLFSVQLPNTIHTIRQRAFGDCKALKEVNIPTSVTRIDGAVFNNCNSLKSIFIFVVRDLYSRTALLLGFSIRYFPSCGICNPALYYY